MSAFFPVDTTALSEVHKLEQLQLLNSRASELATSDARQAIALIEEELEQIRLWCDTAGDEAMHRAFTLELAHGLRLLAQCYSNLSEDRSVEAPAMEALELYTQLQREEEQTDVHNILAPLYWRMGRYGESLQHSFVVLGNNQKSGNKARESRTLNNIALVYDHLGDHSTALEYLLKSLEIDRALGDRKAEHRTLCNVGILYSHMGNYQQALEHHQQCLEYEESAGNKDAVCGALNNIGVVYGELDRYDISLLYFERCLQVHREFGDRSSEAILLCNIGDVYCALGRYDEARPNLLASLELYRHQGNSNGTARALTGLGNLYLCLNDKEQAIVCMEEALALTERSGAKALQYSVHKHLYKIYREQGDPVKALEHHEHFHDIREQVFSETNNKRLAALQTIHQVERSRKEAEIYRLKNIELAQANKQLQTFNVEKNEMLGIVAHDLKNPLSNIRLLAKLMESQPETLQSGEIREYAVDIDTMVNRMFELIDNLLDINKIETHGITVHHTECHAGELLRTVVNNYAHHAANKDIEIKFTDSSDGTPVITDPTLVRQIADNLLSNAIKFSSFHSAVYVRYTTDRSVWRIEVEDEGPGMTEEDRRKLFTKFARLSARPTGNENSTGLGLSIVKKMAEALHGDIHCKSAHGKGTLFIAEFPVSIPNAEAI